MFPDWLTAVFLGLIEGLTEFIPVSSTGHLLIAEKWLPRQSDLFNIVIQSGAVLAVLPLFWERLQMLTRWRDPRARSFFGKILAGVAVTGVGGLLLEKFRFKLPEEVSPVAFALIAGGLAFLLVERWLKGRTSLDSITWPVALAVAAAQLLAAIFPGTSRSGATILVALMLGASRVQATEFSFLVGIPTLLAAAALKIFKALRHAPENAVGEDWALLGLAALVAAVVSFIAVKWLLRYVQTHTFTGFGFYRIALGSLLLLLPLIFGK